MFNEIWSRIANPYRPTPPTAPAPVAAGGASFADLPLLRETIVGQVLASRGAVPAQGVDFAPAGSVESPMAQLNRLAARYQIPANSNTRSWQRAIVRALVIDEARRQGVDPRLALAVAIHESNLTMWSNPRTGAAVKYVNTRENGTVYHSTDWGVMQLNDRAHRRQFPRAAQDVEANVRYAVGMLARIGRSRAARDLGLGLGTWDGILAVYGTGHLPRTESDWALRRRRTPGYQRILAEMAPVT